MLDLFEIDFEPAGEPVDYASDSLDYFMLVPLAWDSPKVNVRYTLPNKLIVLWLNGSQLNLKDKLIHL